MTDLLLDCTSCGGDFWGSPGETPTCGYCVASIVRGPLLDRYFECDPREKTIRGHIPKKLVDGGSVLK